MSLLFLSISPLYLGGALFEGLQTSPTFPSDPRAVKMETSVEHWWKVH
jgi:hypothetical protein